MREHDLQKNGVITREEFKGLMLGVDNLKDLKAMDWTNAEVGKQKKINSGNIWKVLKYSYYLT